MESEDEPLSPLPPTILTEHVPDNWTVVIPRLYSVGMGYLELPQVDVPANKLKQNMLNTKHVYILDCFTDLFVWVGKKSTRLIRAIFVGVIEQNKIQ